MADNGSWLILSRAIANGSDSVDTLNYFPKKGVSIELIAKALGHANLNCIDRYVLTGNDELELALKRIGSAA